MDLKVKIGIIGGSGFYEFLEGEEIEMTTPYGAPSDKILISRYLGQEIAFLPRHGKKHQYPPHLINYRANLFALKKLGVEILIAPTAVGSLKSQIKPGDFVLCDQFIDRTGPRKDTFFEGLTGGILPQEIFGRVAHISTAEPYCPLLRQRAAGLCQKLQIPYHNEGTVIVIEGPRFSTKAESRFWAQSADVINMTQYPEVALARELEMCYLNISLVTDYDVGLKDRDDIQSVSAQEVGRVFRENNEKLKTLILEIIKDTSKQSSCQCQEALKDAFI